MRVFLELLAFCLVSLSPAVARPNSISRSSSSWSDGKLPDWMHDVANPGSKEEFIPGTLAVRDARVMNTIEQWTDYVAEIFYTDWRLCRPRFWNRVQATYLYGRGSVPSAIKDLIYARMEEFFPFFEAFEKCAEDDMQESGHACDPQNFVRFSSPDARFNCLKLHGHLLPKSILSSTATKATTVEDTAANTQEGSAQTDSDQAQLTPGQGEMSENPESNLGGGQASALIGDGFGKLTAGIAGAGIVGSLAKFGMDNMRLDGPT